MMGTTLRQVSDAIEAILEDKIPDIEWKAAVLGPVFPKTLTGYICCDSVDYNVDTKGADTAEATFAIQIICPNPKENPEGTEYVENYAMQVRETLAEEWDLDGWARDSSVEKITFATPAGISSVGVAILEFHVQYEE